MTEKRQLLFVQGGGKGTHDDWDNKLVASLQHELGEGYEVHYPRMPDEDDPNYPRWKTALEKEIGRLRNGAVLVGHSIGGTILLKVLTELRTARSFCAIFLIATPFAGDGGWSSADLQFPPDLDGQLPQDIPIHFFHGLADDIAPPSHVELYARAVPRARVHRLPGRDHQLNDDLSEVATSIASVGALP